MRALSKVELPAAVRDFAAGPGPDDPAEVADARERIRDAIASEPVLYACAAWARVLVPPGASAWTLGRRVLLRRSEWGVDGTDRLVAHELVHVAQWGEHGRSAFLVAYLGAYLRGRLGGLGHWDAYREIPAEVEAYDVEAVVEAHL